MNNVIVLEKLIYKKNFSVFNNSFLLNFYNRKLQIKFQETKKVTSFKYSFLGYLKP